MSEKLLYRKVKDGLRSVLVVLNAIWFKRIYYLILMFKFFLRIFNKWNFSKLRFYYERMKMMWRKNQGKNLEYVTILFQWINIFLNIFPRLNIHYFNAERNLRTFANKKKGKKKEREKINAWLNIELYLVDRLPSYVQWKIVIMYANKIMLNKMWDNNFSKYF